MNNPTCLFKRNATLNAQLAPRQIHKSKSLAMSIEIIIKNNFNKY